MTALDKAWHGVWPAHVPRSLAYPDAPAWALLERNVARFGERVALRELDHDTLAEGRVLTYAALWRAVRGVAAGLRVHGVAPGTRVALVLPNSAALVIGYYATWYAGATAAPVNAGAREGELAQQLGDAAVALVIAPAGSLAATVAAQLKLPHVDVAALRAMEELAPARPRPARPRATSPCCSTPAAPPAPRRARC